MFLLGPSHHHFTRQCLLSPAISYNTPLGAAMIDQQIYAELLETGRFARMRADVDEAEHSLELHMPYLMHIMRGRSFTLVPIMVGALPFVTEAAYGQVLGPYLNDPANLFIISSDFCHWGSRFSYTFHQESKASLCAHAVMHVCGMIVWLCVMRVLCLMCLPARCRVI